MFFSPFEQFQLHYFLDKTFVNVNTISAYLLIVFTFLIFCFFLFFFARNSFQLNSYASFITFLYTFSYSLIDTQLGKKGRQFVPFFQFVFVFLLFSNVIGLVPYSCALTSHFNLVITLSFTLFLGIQYIGFTEYKALFFKLFLPKGTPLGLVAFIILIEFISYIFRVVSLSIRIIANILSGHILLKILSSFAYNIYLNGGYYFLVSLLPVIIVIALSVLEFFVSVLQAYVYTILSCIYLKDVFYVDNH